MYDVHVTVALVCVATLNLALPAPPVSRSLMAFWFFLSNGGGGALVFEDGYHPRQKIHVIRVVFQDQTMYVRTSFKGAKNVQNWKKKKGVFLVILTNFGKDMMVKLRKTHAKKNTYLGSIFIPENTSLGCVLKVLLRGWCPTWNTSGPGLAIHVGLLLFIN